MLFVHSLQFYLFSILIHLFIIFTYLVYYSDIFSARHVIKREYDYIIVGSGTAGSLIAHRLSTETNYTYIVLEAGGRSSPLFEIPILGPLLHGSLYDWQYDTVSQDNACLAMKDKKCRLTQGKIVGGSAKLNNMIHVRGNVSHYVEWFEGKYDEQYIRKQFEFIENDIIHVSDLQYESDLANGLLNAAIELGYTKTDTDFKKGFMKSRVSQRNGKRWSTSDLGQRVNLITNALVEKVFFKERKACGVKVVVSNRKETVYARKGVILSAGTYNSPKILQLSGVGPSSLLKSLKIPVLKDLPVGFNLQDHVTTGLDLVLFNKSLALSAMDMLNPFNVYKYFVNGVGPLTSPGCEVVGFLSSIDEIDPDIQFMVLPVGISSDRGSHLMRNLRITDDIWKDYFAKIFDKTSSSILPIVLHPKSKGEVFINSTDAAKAPLINPKFLSNRQDVDTLVSGLKLVKKFIETDSMRSLGAQINPVPFPGCENFKIFSNIYWECYVRHLTLTSFHPVGTCSMGARESSRSVVDTSFKVVDLENIFVVDASILPTLPSGNINAAVAMMANVFYENNIAIVQIEAEIKVCYSHENVYENIFKICLRWPRF